MKSPCFAGLVIAFGTAAARGQLNAPVAGPSTPVVALGLAAAPRFDAPSFDAMSDAKRLALVIAALAWRDQQLQNFSYDLEETVTSNATLINIRKTAGLTSTSVVNIVAADDQQKYAAIIDDKVALKLGPAPWDPGAGWNVATSGNDFAVWTIQHSVS